VELGGVLGRPEVAEGLGVGGHDRHRAAGDAANLGEAPVEVGPVVDREDRQGGLEGVVVEGERVGGGIDRRGQGRIAAGAHLGRGLDRDDVAVGRLVGAGPGADVEDRARVAERGDQLRGDPGVGAPHRGVVGRQVRVVGVVPVGHRLGRYSGAHGGPRGARAGDGRAAVGRRRRSRRHPGAAGTDAACAGPGRLPSGRSYFIEPPLEPAKPLASALNV
jgi:hypothetical protein